MAEDTENHTIRLLQEMRQEMRDGFAKIDEKFEDVHTRMDGMMHIMTLMAGHSHDLDERVDALEERFEPS